MNVANEKLIERPAIAVFGLEINVTAMRQRKKDHTKETHKVLKTGNQNYYKLIERADLLQWPARSRSMTNFVMARLHHTIVSRAM